MSTEPPIKLDVVLGRIYNPNTQCYEAPGRKPIPAEQLKFPMDGANLLRLLREYE